MMALRSCSPKKHDSGFRQLTAATGGEKLGETKGLSMTFAPYYALSTAVCFTLKPYSMCTIYDILYLIICQQMTIFFCGQYFIYKSVYHALVIMPSHHCGPARAVALASYPKDVAC